MTDPLTPDPDPFVEVMPELAVAFEKFDAENEHVYHALVMLAREWIRHTGSHEIGIATLYERARWELAIQTKSADFRLSNNHRAFYARLIMWLEPDLRGMFDVKQSDADVWMRIRTAGLPMPQLDSDSSP